MAADEENFRRACDDFWPSRLVDTEPQHGAQVDRSVPKPSGVLDVLGT